MDAKERHELKDNDLAEFLENFGVFWGKHGNSISVAFLIFVASWLGIKYYNSMQVTRHENAWADLASTTTPQGYRERAKENTNYTSVADLALLRGAEAYHEQAIGLENEGTKPDSGLMSAEESLKNAESMYKQVYDSGSDPVFLANAAVGLANVAETRENFEAAKEYWTKAKVLADEAGLSAISVQADIRLELLPDLASPIFFAEPAASSATESAPASNGGTDDVPTQAPTEAPVSPDAQAPADPG